MMRLSMTAVWESGCGIFALRIALRGTVGFPWDSYHDHRIVLEASLNY